MFPCLILLCVFFSLQFFESILLYLLSLFVHCFTFFKKSIYVDEYKTSLTNKSIVPGLERIAEELMGRRKWKLYQESTSRNYLQPLNNNVKKLGDIQRDLTDAKSEPDRTSDKEDRQEVACENSRPNSRREEDEVAAAPAAVKEREAEDRLKDWSPQSKCFFCADGKLDSDHNNHGVLVSFHSVPKGLKAII